MPPHTRHHPCVTNDAVTASLSSSSRDPQGDKVRTPAVTAVLVIY